MRDPEKPLPISMPCSIQRELRACLLYLLFSCMSNTFLED